MIKKLMIPAVIGAVVLMTSAPAWSDGWGFGLFGKSRGHGYAYPFKDQHGCKTCVPYLAKKKRIVYDYVCVPFCVHQCEKCARSFRLLVGHHGHGCDCDNCQRQLECPNCCIRYKRILVKRYIECGEEWKCKVADHGHGAPFPPGVVIPPGGEIVPIQPPGVKIMPPAKNGGPPKKMPSAKNGGPLKKMPPAKNGNEKIVIPPPKDVAPRPLPGGSAISTPLPVGSPSTETAPVVPEVPHISFSAPGAATPLPGQPNVPSIPNLAIPNTPQLGLPGIPTVPTIPDPVR